MPRKEQNALSVGQRFGRLVIQKPSGRNKHGHMLFACVCDCKNRTTVTKASLVGGRTRSCGCLFLQNAGSHLKTHGWSSTSDPIRHKFWRVFKEINRRCNNKNSKSYLYYGGRGITTSWRKFEEFRRDMWKSFEDHVRKNGAQDTTIDRVDNNLGYDKKNTRWATWNIQQNNKRTTVYVIFRGKKMNVAELSKIPEVQNRVKYDTLLYRINAGWDIERAIS
jgi:hypothetical protein